LLDQDPMRLLHVTHVLSNPGPKGTLIALSYQSKGARSPLLGACIVGSLLCSMFCCMAAHCLQRETVLRLGSRSALGQSFKEQMRRSLSDLLQIPQVLQINTGCLRALLMWISLSQRV
jgi:H+/gluconate symporter-like permease